MLFSYFIIQYNQDKVNTKECIFIMLLFNEKTCVNICLKNKNKYVRLAVEDMRKDFERVSERCLCPQLVDSETEFCIVIEENSIENAEPIENESYIIKTCGNKIIISAETYLGTMWGIYTFCEKFLGVDPCYIFNDMEIKKHKALDIPNVNISEAPEGFKFRGVFINDEDLLTGWKDGGGIRYLDYKWYGVTVEKNVMEMVVETILRLKLNLVIPASFLDIDNYPEKVLAECVANRGIYVSQHHLEPLGLSVQTFGNYCRKYGKNAEFSYSEYPEIMEEAWKFYSKKWAEFDHVVWQIGLRGKNDRPIWEEETPTDEELEKYGKFISTAYEKQKEIVMSATNGTAKYFTSTLWMEGSALAEKGYLNFPKDVIMIFADTGPNQMYGKEYNSVARKKDTDYGIYYHLQFFCCGPHLAPQTGLDKLYYNIGLAYEKGDRAYFIMNVSNIREFVFELKAYSQMAWNFKTFSKEKYLDEYCLNYGAFAEAAKKNICEYYNSLPEIDKKYLSMHHSKYFNYDTENSPMGIKNFIVKDGMLLLDGAGRIISNFHKQLCKTDNILCREFYNAANSAIENYERLCRNFELLAENMPKSMNKHIKSKWLLYSKTLLCTYKWYVNLYEAKCYCDMYESEKMKSALNAACESLEEYLKYRKCAEYGIFENWYRGDLKLNVKQKLYATKELLGQTPDLL